MRARWLMIAVLAAGFGGTVPAAPPSADTDDYTVAAYYFPSYHPDPAYDRDYGKGFTEWDLIRAARPRFDGHDQPRTPLWGFDDESDPARMTLRIDAPQTTAWMCCSSTGTGTRGRDHFCILPWKRDSWPHPTTSGSGSL